MFDMTVAETIQALGGTARVASALGVVPSAVRNWRRLDAFPPRTYLALSDIAKQKRVAIDRGLFRELTGSERV